MQPHQLSTALRALKLSGILDTLEVRLGQARAGELGHLEFLEVLLEDEIARREQRALSERLRRARFEEEATLEDFDFTYNPQLPVAVIRDLATLRFLARIHRPPPLGRLFMPRRSPNVRWHTAGLLNKTCWFR
jgi:DNA replication protein DnaC